jgi:hypothetical protein
MTVRESMNCAIWMRVFAEHVPSYRLASMARLGPEMGANTEMIFEGSSVTAYPDVQVIGIFKCGAQQILIEIDFNASHDEILITEMRPVEAIDLDKLTREQGSGPAEHI